MNNISSGLLQQGVQLKILAINTFKHPINIDALPEGYRRKTAIETVFVDTRIKILDAAFNLFSNDSYNVRRFYSKAFEEKITDALHREEYDIIHLESLFVTPYLDTIRKNTGAAIIYRAHNIEFEIWKEMACSEKKILKKKYLNFLSERIKNYELGMMNRFDGIAVISGEDAKEFRKLGCSIPMENIPLGINFSEYLSPELFPRGYETNLFFLGSMDWLPNREGVEWFLENVWKILREKNPGLKFFIAGKGMPGSFSGSGMPGTEIIGEVADARQFMLSNGIMVVPLLSGSGIRVKIIEAMALGKVVVASSIAAKGIGCEHKKNILIADSPEEFADLISQAVIQSEWRKNISENARKFVRENFDNEIITKQLISFYNRVIQ